MVLSFFIISALFFVDLFSVARCRRRRVLQLTDAPNVHIPVLPEEHVQIFSEAEAVVQQYLNSSSYHFVPHGIFDYVKRVNELAGIKVEQAGGKKTSRKGASGAATAAAGAVASAGDMKRARLSAPAVDSASVSGTGMMGLQED